MTKRRLDAQDTIDPVIHLLHKLQSEGWCLDNFETVVGYGEVGKKSAAIPMSTSIIIRLRPVLT